MNELSKEDTLELSTQEKMLLALRKTYQLRMYLEIVIIGSLLFLGMVIASNLFFTNVILESGTIEPLEDCISEPYFEEICHKFTLFPDVDAEILIIILDAALNTSLFFTILAIFVIGSVGIWLYVRGRTIKKDLSKLHSDYTNQAYFFTLSTALHGSSEDVAMDFFELAEDIFPELKREEVSSLEKKGVEWEVEDVTVVDDTDKKEKKEFRFDVAAKTKEGYFLVQYFPKDEVSYEEIDETLKIAKESFKTWTKDPFRLVILAKGFSKQAIEGYESLIENKTIPVDFILVKEKGFSFIKIGTETFE